MELGTKFFVPDNSGCEGSGGALGNFMSFNKIIKEGNGNNEWSVFIIINNFGSFQVVQVLKFQNIKLDIICIWIFKRCATSNVSHCSILKDF